MMRNMILSVLEKIRNNDFEREYKIISSLKTKEDYSNFSQTLLEKLLIHATRQVPYYQNLLNEYHVINEGELNLSNFYKLPFLKKKYFSLDDMKSADLKKRKYYINHSGGSTGEPTTFIQDKIYKKWASATKCFYFNNILGLNESKEKKSVLWGSPIDFKKYEIGLKNKIGLLLNNTQFLNSFNLTEDNINLFIRKINSFKPTIIKGYAGSLFKLCEYSEKKGKYLHNPKVVISTAENLTIPMRRTIERNFGTKVYSFYGSRETASLAGECKKGLIHIFSFNNIIEILNKDGKNVAEGETGNIIVTNLHNYSMPFIRFEIGDIAVKGPKNCNCGCKLPTIKELKGRKLEQFIREDGNIVIGYYFVHLMAVVYNEGIVKKFQFIQEDYNKITIKVVAIKRIPPNERRKIEHNIRRKMGNNCKINWEYEKDIPKSKSGKFFYTISNVR